MQKLLTVCLSQIMLTALITSKAQAGPDSLANVMQDLGRQSNPVEWIKQQQTRLRNDPVLTRRLSLELLAESLRTSPQPWPVQAEQTLEALLQIQPQPDIQEALHPNLFTAQTPLRQMITSAQALKQQRSLTLYQQQLNQCYRLNILSCQAEMQYQIGQFTDLTEEDRLAAFQAGQESAEKAGHLPLTLLNQMSTAVFEDYLDENGSEILDEVLKSSSSTHLTQIEAMTELEWGRYLRDIDYEPEEAQAHFEKSLNLWPDLLKQAQIHFELGKNYDEIDQTGRARISWNQALAILNPDQDIVLYRQILEALSQSYLHSRPPNPAIPYLETLIKTLPEGSEARYIQMLRLAEASLHTDAEISKQLVIKINQDLQNQSEATAFPNWLQLASYYQRTSQSEQALAILDKQILNPNLAAELRSKALFQMMQHFPEAASIRALGWMKEENKVLRESAVNTLNQTQPKNLLIKLLELLDDPDPRVRGNVIQVLWRTAGAPILPELLKLKNDTNPHVRSNLLSALQQDIQSTIKLISPAGLKTMMQGSDQNNVAKITAILAATPQGQQLLLEMALDPRSPQQFQALQAFHSAQSISPEVFKKLVSLLESQQQGLAYSASGILGRKAYPDLWPSIVAIIQKKPVHLEASIDVLRAWKIPESVRQLKDFAKSSDTRLQNAFIKLFSSVPMQQQDADLIKHLIKPDIREEQRWPAIAALLPLNNQLAWQQFENLFMAQTQENARELQMIWINQIQIPCLPASAFITAPNALNSPQHLIWNRNFLSVGNLQQIWNGQTCVAFNSLPANVQADIKQALRQLYTSQDGQLRTISARYLRVWAPEAL